ncbi:MAG: hypothetical protein L3J63_06390 [Geopsychrobacter sp.]|nr:hypothetical protein [Geopsychrobacter sp.]
MKCPKCGYNSFDHLDSCKKCNKDLTEHKARFSIQSILLSEISTVMAATDTEQLVATAPATDLAFDDFGGGNVEDSADDFGFDFMGDSDDEENLAFDELFEEVASEDDIEETLPAPEAEEAPAQKPSSPATEESLTDDFTFDESETETSKPVETNTVDPEEFGFDAEEDPAADIFAETEEDFSLDALDIEDAEKK